MFDNNFTFNLPTAPAEGLILHSCVYMEYNRTVRYLGNRKERVDFDSLKDQQKSMMDQVILPRIVNNGQGYLIFQEFVDVLNSAPPGELEKSVLANPKMRRSGRIKRVSYPI